MTERHNMAHGPDDALPSAFRVALAAGCAVALVSFGLRGTFGLFTAPLSEARGWERDVFALAVAIQNLAWGIGQPLAGIVADRWGSARVVAVGGLLYVLGIAAAPFGDTPVLLHLTVGVLTGLGMGGASYITVVAALGRMAPASRRSWALGVGTAAGSLGQFVVVPMGQVFIGTFGWDTALLLLATLGALMPLLAIGLVGDRPAIGEVGSGSRPGPGALMVIAGAFRLQSYRLLVAGFFVCGFQLAFITIHLPPWLSDLGMDPSVAALGIALVGLFNVIGAYTSGVLSARMSRRLVLSGIYFGRAFAVAVFITLPVTPASVLVFGAVMGLLWLSTVPPTSGLIAVFFGTRHLATLFGVTFFSHQIGSFLGVWLAAVIVEVTGSYDGAWWLSVLLGVCAGLVHLPIREIPAEPRLRFA
jgi:MFS family permease